MKLNQKLSILFWAWNSKPDQDGNAPMWVRITLDGNRSQFSLGLKIKPGLFSNKTGRAKGNSPDAVRINNQINIIRGKLQQCYNKLSLQHDTVLPEMLKNIFVGETFQYPVLHFVNAMLHGLFFVPRHDKGR